ncbi:unnamed protein product [Closterium sp. NIES-65]|nr:unnamed protein product [Closterium sp. NIES-65]
MILLSFVGPAARCEFGLSAAEESLIASVVFLGVFLGSYVWGLVADAYSRRRGFTMTPLPSSQSATSRLSCSHALIFCLSISGAPTCGASWQMRMEGGGGSWPLLSSTQLPRVSLPFLVSHLPFHSSCIRNARGSYVWGLVADAYGRRGFMASALSSETPQSNGISSLFLPCSHLLSVHIRGSYVWGLVADAYGRRRGFMATALFTLFAGLLSQCDLTSPILYPLRGHPPSSPSSSLTALWGLASEGLLCYSLTQYSPLLFPLPSTTQCVVAPPSSLSSSLAALWGLASGGGWLPNIPSPSLPSFPHTTPHSAWSPTFLTLLVSRCLVGFGIGGASVVFSLCSEFLPSHCRGFWLVFIEFFWTIGSLIEAALAWAVMPSLHWRALVLLSAAPFALLLLLYLPSPVTIHLSPLAPLPPFLSFFPTLCLSRPVSLPPSLSSCLLSPSLTLPAHPFPSMPLPPLASLPAF